MNKRHILIVDDDDVTCKTLSRVLVNENFKVSCTDSGQEALKIVSDNINSDDSIFLLITDLIMPKMQGDELVREIKKIDKNLRIIVITAHSYDELKLIRDNMNLEILEKPFGVEKLINCINRQKEFSYKK